MNTEFYGEIFMEEDNLRRNGIYYPIKIAYYKTEETNEEKYGIKVIKTEYQDEKMNVEENTINAISNDKNIVDKILKIFKENEVTPIIAEDVISDYFYKN